LTELPTVTMAKGRGGAAARVVVGVFPGERGEASRLPAPVRQAVHQATGRSGWRASAGQTAQVPLRSGSVVEVIGLGERERFDARSLRGFVELALESARAAGDRDVLVAVPDHDVGRQPLDAARIARQAALATYRFERFLAAAKPRRPRLRECRLLPPGGAERGWEQGVERGVAVAAGVALARDLANTPPNEATPDWMARAAARLARRHGATVRVLGTSELRRRGMGGLLAVGGGSANPPRLARIELGRGPRTVALVGKGVTFDTGGISIKPADRMEEMKWDKSGACAVLGILEAAARLRLGIRLRAYLPLAENMPDGTAYRPGDIVRCANGKTVEIVNTDAEGRMILADALSWAAQEKPDVLLEYSTLTGACVVALGPTGAGLFTPDDELAAGLLQCAEAAGERLWRLPLWEEFLDEMKGTHSDLKNSGGRWGGASTAAAFLSQFVAPLSRWAHLDIAGPAYVGTEGAKSRRGATGFGVALTIDWLARQAGARSG
jgi:leucyl aminopeptidase